MKKAGCEWQSKAKLVAAKTETAVAISMRLFMEILLVGAGQRARMRAIRGDRLTALQVVARFFRVMFGFPHTNT